MLRVHELRKAKGITQAELAERAGVSRSYLSMIESGRKHPNAIRLQALADGLGVTVAELISPSEDGEALFQHLEIMRRLSPTHQEAVIDLARRLAESEGA